MSSASYSKNCARTKLFCCKSSFVRNILYNFGSTLNQGCSIPSPQGRSSPWCNVIQAEVPHRCIGSPASCGPAFFPVLWVYQSLILAHRARIQSQHMWAGRDGAGPQGPIPANRARLRESRSSLHGQPQSWCTGSNSAREMASHHSSGPLGQNVEHHWFKL